MSDVKKQITDHKHFEGQAKDLVEDRLNQQGMKNFAKNEPENFLNEISTVGGKISKEIIREVLKKRGIID